MSNDWFSQVNSQAMGAQQGFMTPADAYGAVYEQPGYASAVNDYYNSLYSSLDAEDQQAKQAMNHEVEWAVGGLLGDNVDLLRSGVIKYNPQTGLVEVDPKAAASNENTGWNMGASSVASRAQEVAKHANTSLQSNDNYNRLRAQEQNRNQRRAAIKAEQAGNNNNSGFRQELNRMDKERAAYEARRAPNMMKTYMEPGLAQAAQSAMAGANATTGGSLAQAAARRAAMGQFGATAALAPAQAAAMQQQANQQQMAANDQMAQGYISGRQNMIQNNFQNNLMASNQRYQQGLAQQQMQFAREQVAHGRDKEGTDLAMNIGKGVGSLALGAATGGLFTAGTAAAGALGAAAGGGNPMPTTPR